MFSVNILRAAPSKLQCITRHLTYSMHAEMQISKHFSALRQREGDKKGHRDREGEHSVNDYEGKDEPAERSSSSFPTSPQRREPYTPCFVLHTKTKISAVYTLLMGLKIRVSTPVALEGLKGHETEGVFAVYLGI